jgi:hypothetical protein
VAPPFFPKPRKPPQLSYQIAFQWGAGGANETIREGNETAALEVMSRFAANPKWLIYLTAGENLSRLRNRGLGGKRSLALREFALGIEALERFIRHEPLRRVHECVFGVLALESEPVDPRL